MFRISMKSWKGWKGWGRESWKAKGEILMLVGTEENHPKHHHGGHNNDDLIIMTMMLRWVEGVVTIMIMVFLIL